MGHSSSDPKHGWWSFLFFRFFFSGFFSEVFFPQEFHFRGFIFRGFFLMDFSGFFFRVFFSGVFFFGFVLLILYTALAGETYRLGWRPLRLEGHFTLSGETHSLG
jgi:hypothetical protein